ncbi:hypothetical protein P7L75_00505 (plasmid) [Tistrella mobilis]|uniref:hypothetical protein n=1 Tax=Tistrella mobilis TaxID=171437 RepID=UPI003557E996
MPHPSDGEPDPAIERRLREDVPRAWEEYLAHPDQAVSSEDLLDVVHADYLAGLAKRG